MVQPGHVLVRDTVRLAQLQCQPGRRRHIFDHDSSFERSTRALPYCEDTMVFEQHRRRRADRLDNHTADLLPADQGKTTTRDWPPKFVRLRREIDRNRPSVGGKGRGIARMGVDNPVEVGPVGEAREFHHIIGD